MRNLSRMFFNSGHASDEEYILLRDDSRYSKAKARIEQLWTVHEHYADKPKQFLQDAKCQLHQRIWEMILTNTFKTRGYSPKKVSDAGPEFFMEISGKKFWVEAIAPGPGTGADAVPPPPSPIVPGESNEDDQCYDPPYEKIELRLTSALATKLEKYEKDQREGRILPDDGYILAINGNKAVNGWQAAADIIPSIIKAVLPFGPEFVSWNPKTKEIVESGYSYRPEISNKNEKPVTTCWLQNERFKGITLIVYSEYGILNLPEKMGSEFHFVHNPLANHPIPEGVFGFGGHYWVEGDQLRLKIYP